jgi:hypothetical protein
MISSFKFATFIFLTYFFTAIQPYESKIITRDQYQLNNISPCIENLTYPINLTEIYFNPYPITMGSNLNTTLIGTSITTIQPGASIILSLSSNGNLISNNKFDLCLLIESTGGKCPISPGIFEFTANTIPFISSINQSNSTFVLDYTLTGMQFNNFKYHILYSI